MKTISFVLPCLSRYPSGGFKVIYEYANAFAARGYNVNLLFDITRSLARFNFPKLIKNSGCYVLNKIYPQWFHLNKNIVKMCIDGINEKSIPDGDIIVATAIQTAFPVSKLSNFKGKKIYFIQGFEAWGGCSEQEVYSSYQLGMVNVVVSNFLKQRMIKNTGIIPEYIPNFVDMDVFNLDIMPKQRDPYTIAMLCAEGPSKGTKYGLEVLHRLKMIYPALSVNLFGTVKNFSGVESWMKYTFSATAKELRYIYNNSSIYLYPSLLEGWGLTGMESMACGCAYVASDYGGVHEYAEQNKHVLLSAPKDVDGLLNHTITLIESSKKRCEMAMSGYNHIKHNFSKEKSFSKFEALCDSIAFK